MTASLVESGCFGMVKVVIGEDCFCLSFKMIFVLCVCGSNLV